MAQAQERVRMSVEEAEGIVARGLAGLPEVAAVYYTAEGDRWNLTVLHDYGSVAEAATRVVHKLHDVEKKVPHLDIRPFPIQASTVLDGYLKGEKMIYER